MKLASRLLVIAAAGVIMCCSSLAVCAASPGRPAGAQLTNAVCGSEHWVGTWAASPSHAGNLLNGDLGPFVSVAEQTYRLIITPHRGGDIVRLHLSNRFGSQPVTFAQVSIAHQDHGAVISSDTLREVTFSGRPSVTAEPGTDVVSDPVRLSFQAFQNLAISMYVPHLLTDPTQHASADATSYYSHPGAGNHVRDTDATALPNTTTNMPFLSSLDVQAPAGVTTLVALGDSLTDGAYIGANGISDRAGNDRNIRYPDFLQHRLDQANRPLSVSNAGIGGNRLTADAPFYLPFAGPSVQHRIEHDVLNQPSVSDVIMLIGINDLTLPPVTVTYKQMVDAYTTVINQLRSAGIKVHLATIMPGHGVRFGPVTITGTPDPIRNPLNEWIRTQHLSDSVVDFDAAVRDPAQPNRLATIYAGPDDLHLSPAGYARLSEAVDLDMLGVRCR
ncbi:GDSL-type esterase/lipase family protein [Nocardia neocaledoniensis]|uniref:GDSL-type esterase/lipase family protein n=1 Tax=Nocardia neocaledoniensis TaxID=236511 RepID=UPI0024559997|nr:GDSL-type esterase/lipase family protein [Nocardia neocaledoniensis]